MQNPPLIRLNHSGRLSGRRALAPDLDLRSAPLNHDACGRAVFHGKRGELRQRYREGQEDQLRALGLVVNIVVLWNTLYMAAAVEWLKQQGYPVLDEDLARLSPLI